MIGSVEIGSTFIVGNGDGIGFTPIGDLRVAEDEVLPPAGPLLSLEVSFPPNVLGIASGRYRIDIVRI